VDGFSHVLSHELAESLSCPDGDGYTVNPGAGWPQPVVNVGPFTFDKSGQIADFEPDQNYLFHLTSGVQV